MKFIPNSNISIQRYAFENVVCKMAAILFRPQHVKPPIYLYFSYFFSSCNIVSISFIPFIKFLCVDRGGDSYQLSLHRENYLYIRVGSSRVDSRLAPSQWETSLQSNTVSHWLGTNLESALGQGHVRWISVNSQSDVSQLIFIELNENFVSSTTDVLSNNLVHIDDS